MHIINHMAWVLESSLRSNALLDSLNVGSELGQLGNDVASHLVNNISLSKLIIDLLLISLKLLNDDWEILVECSSGLNWDAYLLELGKFLLVSIL